ncbi:uncharacterized protein LOC122513017 [Leptopilina heterotoma]|uniref:uncharacterized protein LOC122513017 n=1 Tax=Leptopilina heterotoma TaxID=63436 RepID=UPI001CA7BC9C|nr:uncharacterized protein LOC122513017 [Leptopilina heterotoma]
MIWGIDLTQTKINSFVNATIWSTQNEYNIKSEFFVTNNISHCIPTRELNREEITIPEHIILADPEYYKSKPVDLLLGTNVFWDSLEPQQIKQGRGHPVLQLTKFGWILGGLLSATNSENHFKSRSSFCGFLSDGSLNDQVERFWQMNEEIPNKEKSEQELECDKMFKASYTRDADGRFEVDILLKRDVSELGESRSNAEKRLLATERRLLKDESMKVRYSEFLEEYLSVGHMSLIPKDQLFKDENYLPQHAVFKESSTSTKLRVVFDASCKTKSGISLNDCVMVGPTIQRELFDIIVRFR